jgi:hypothetical protein
MHLLIEVATISFETTHVRSQGASTVGGGGDGDGHEVSIYDLRDDSLVIIWERVRSIPSRRPPPRRSRGPPVFERSFESALIVFFVFSISLPYHTAQYTSTGKDTVAIEIV